MKKLTTLILCLSILPSVFGQKLDYDHDSKWFFGLNAGAAWNTTDVKNKTHIGYGFTFGRSFNYNYGKKFSFDLRFRYLGGKWYGQDYDTTTVTGNSGYNPTGNVAQLYDSLGHTINNFQAQVHEVGLELVLHANGLRERTGWDPYIFGGAHFVWNQTYGDLYSQDSTSSMNQHYNYSTNGISKGEWKGISDNIYDSALDGSDQTIYNVNFMPSIGIGLAYQVGPRFSIGIEHKTNFTLRNDFDGYQGATKKWGVFKNDIYHYTSLMLKFNFRSRKVENEIEAVNNDCLKPAIGIVTPVLKTLTVSSTQLDVEALISQISGKNNIQFALNGIKDTNFVYSVETSKLQKSVVLIKGQNTIDITASNGCGTVTESINVLFEECVPPTVAFVNPTTTEITTNDQSYTVTAQLERAKTITYSINDKELRNYSFNDAEKTFSSTITLAEGKNSIKIVVNNECGTQEQVVDVIYVRCDKPIVKINNSDRDLKVDNSNYTANALFENISSKTQVSLKLNNVIKTFAYNSSSKELIQKLTLKEGNNVIEITAKNDCGEMTETITIEYTACITPKIAMISPSTSSIRTEEILFSVQAKIENISNANQVSINLNGKNVGSGSYNPSSKIFNQNVSLIGGNNTVVLTVTSTCGTVKSAFSVIRTIVDKDMTICFKRQTLIVKESQWNSYQSQGATQGECPEPVDKDMTICFKGQTLIVKESQWRSYQSQGATQGECPEPVDKDITICFKGQKLIVKESQWNSYQSQGATPGECPEPVDKDMTICLKGQTLIAKESQWRFYQSQGATQGECPEPMDKDMTICYNDSSIIIKQSQWAEYATLGAISGTCLNQNGEVVQEETMVICHFTGAKPVQLEIPVSAWASHLAHGDSEGPCLEVSTVGNDEIVICLNGETKTIKKIQLAKFKLQGATEGPCN
ncbi:MAG: hypothetical protein QNL61_06015 [Crocinitomicaceae bacterium]